MTHFPLSTPTGGTTGRLADKHTYVERETHGLLRYGLGRQAGVLAPQEGREPTNGAAESPTGCGPWLSVVEAARHAGWPCKNGRAPQSFYDLAKRIGSKFNGKWRIHVDDLDAEIRRCLGCRHERHRKEGRKQNAVEGTLVGWRKTAQASIPHQGDGRGCDPRCERPRSTPQKWYPRASQADHVRRASDRYLAQHDARSKRWFEDMLRPSVNAFGFTPLLSLMPDQIAIWLAGLPDAATTNEKRLDAMRQVLKMGVDRLPVADPARPEAVKGPTAQPSDVRPFRSWDEVFAVADLLGPFRPR